MVIHTKLLGSGDRALRAMLIMFVSLSAQRVIARMIEWYNTERLHSALGYLRPMDYYRGDPATLHEARRRKIAEARHRRRETNLKLRHPTLPLEPMESIANKKPGMSHCG